MEKEQKQYLEKLLDWCNDTYSDWERMKPRFSKQFDLKSLEEWEESYNELKGKLVADLKEDFDHYQKAQNLYNQYKLLYRESQPCKEEVESDVRKIGELSSNFDRGIEILGQENDTVEELDN